MKPANSPVPEGHHTITPSLTVRDAAKAIEFYIKALGAQEVMRMESPDGTVGHAEIRIGDSIIDSSNCRRVCCLDSHRH